AGRARRGNHREALPMPFPANLEAAMSVAPTLAPGDAAQRLWDVIVVGAGPAGALAARELARRGLAVLLVDQASFPRGKGCGCCLSLRTLSRLASVGLGDLPVRLGAVPLHEFCVAAAGRRAVVPLPGGAALSREALDAALVEAAAAAGASFLPETLATCGP